MYEYFGDLLKYIDKRHARTHLVSNCFAEGDMMIMTFAVPSLVEEWQRYAMVVYQSKEFRKRRKAYNQKIADLKPGKMIVAECEFIGTREKERIPILEFHDYNNVLERRADPCDRLFWVKFLTVRVE